MHQVSNLLYCSDFLYDIQIPSLLLNKAYFDYPFLIVGEFMSKDECESVLEHIKQTYDYELARVKSTSMAVDLSIRNTEIYALTAAQDERYELKFDAIRAQVERFFNLSLLGASDAQVLSYNKDSFYIRHADDSSEIVDSNGDAVDYKQVAPQRVITTVLFLNSGGEDFSGGDREFSHLSDINGVPFRFSPKQGLMVIFPSNPYFAHEVLKVTDGHRASLVKWHNAIVY